MNANSAAISTMSHLTSFSCVGPAGRNNSMNAAAVDSPDNRNSGPSTVEFHSGRAPKVPSSKPVYVPRATPAATLDHRMAERCSRKNRSVPSAMRVGSKPRLPSVPSSDNHSSSPAGYTRIRIHEPHDMGDSGSNDR